MSDERPAMSGGGNGQDGLRRCSDSGGNTGGNSGQNGLRR